jgi:hypothetical protein
MRDMAFSLTMGVAAADGENQNNARRVRKKAVAGHLPTGQYGRDARTIDYDR